MLEIIKQWDRRLFLVINQHGTDFIDPLMILLSDKWIWIPLYLWIILSLIQKYDRAFLIWLLSIVVLIVLTDQITSSFMKPFFGRLRPCHAAELREWLRLVQGCGGKYGFVSSHAANTAGLSVFVFLANRNNRTICLLFWSFAVGFSRVYLGVHYPADVLAGWLTGALLASVVFGITSLVSPLISSRTSL